MCRNFFEVFKSLLFLLLLLENSQLKNEWKTEGKEKRKKTDVKIEQILGYAPRKKRWCVHTPPLCNWPPCPRDLYFSFFALSRPSDKVGGVSTNRALWLVATFWLIMMFIQPLASSNIWLVGGQRRARYLGEVGGGCRGEFIFSSKNQHLPSLPLSTDQACPPTPPWSEAIFYWSVD